MGLKGRPRKARKMAKTLRRVGRRPPCAPFCWRKRRPVGRERAVDGIKRSPRRFKKNGKIWRPNGFGAACRRALRRRTPGADFGWGGSAKSRPRRGALTRQSGSISRLAGKRHFTGLSNAQATRGLALRSGRPRDRLWIGRWKPQSPEAKPRAPPSASGKKKKRLRAARAKGIVRAGRSL